RANRIDHSCCEPWRKRRVTTTARERTRKVEVHGSYRISQTSISVHWEFLTPARFPCTIIHEGRMGRAEAFDEPCQARSRLRRSRSRFLRRSPGDPSGKGSFRRRWRISSRNYHHGRVQALGHGGGLGDFHATCEPKGAEEMTSKKFSSKRPLTDDEEAEIQRMIASDPDNPELNDEQIAGLRPFAEVLPALAESIKRGPGRPKLERTLEAVTLRLDPTVVEHFRAQGADWRKRMAQVLEKAAS